MSMRFNMSQHGAQSKNPAKGLRDTNAKKNEWILDKKKPK